MLYYRFEGRPQDSGWLGEGEEEKLLRARCRSVAADTMNFNASLEGKAYYFAALLAARTITIGAVLKDNVPPDKTLAEFQRKTGLNMKETLRKEITLEDFRAMVRNAWRSSSIMEDEDDVMERFGMGDLQRDFIRRVEYKEYILPEKSMETIYDNVARIPVRETLLPELDRICSGPVHPNLTGHPVHYFIETDDSSVRTNTYGALLGALLDRKRLHMRRYGTMNLAYSRDISKSGLDCIYRSCTGGAMIIDYSDQILYEEDEDYASPNRSAIESISEVIRIHAPDVLTVICFPGGMHRMKSLFTECLGSMTFVELKEELMNAESGKAFLRLLAGDSRVRPDQKLYAELKDNKSWSITELREMYGEWFNRKLKTSIYPQYRDLVSIRKKSMENKARGSAWDELTGMIGLEAAKKTIRQALNYYKARRLFADKGMKGDRPAMHMVFTGSPGTAKTTVARLFTQIMKDNGLLTKGRLVETGRGELVGKYVGWTAPNIKRKFQEARGGVLFIDEAYSLVDDRDGSFGDEAINTIVQEMENHREDTIVIFAGYPDKMEEFIRKNPGLRSRIAFHVSFEDYSTQELTEIAERMAGQDDLTLTEEARARIREIAEEARKVPDFGNGRFIRNLLEKARMAQADRLMEKDPDHISRKEIATIRAEDIEKPVRSRPERKIGF